MLQRLTKIQFLLLYGLALGGLLSLMAWSKYRFVVIDHALELYMLLIAVVFVAVGIWAGLHWSAPTVVQKTIVVPVPAPPVRHVPDQQMLDRLGISPRELAVLGQLAKGLSNEEIAESLFVSTNTVKTHLANLYTKLDVRRRTQAIEKAREIGLI